MKADPIKHLDAVLPNSSFDFGDFFSRGFDIWKKDAGLYIGFGVLLMIMSFVISLIPYIGSVINNLILTPCLTAGAYYFCHKSRFDNSSDFANFFEKFKSFTPILLINLFIGLFAMFLFLPFVFLIGLDNISDLISGDPDAVLSVMANFDPLSLLYFIPCLLILSLAGFAIHFLIFYKLSPIDSIKYSAKFIFKHWIFYLLYFITIMIASMSGILACGIGIFVTYTFMFPLSYEAFRGLTQLDQFVQEDDDDDVLDMLIEA